MRSDLRQALRRRSGTAVLGCLVLAAGLTAPVLASTRSTANHTLSPSLDLKTVRVSAGPEEERILTLTPGGQPSATVFTSRSPSTGFAR